MVGFPGTALVPVHDDEVTFELVAEEARHSRLREARPPVQVEEHGIRGLPAAHQDPLRQPTQGDPFEGFHSGWARDPVLVGDAFLQPGAAQCQPDDGERNHAEGAGAEERPEDPPRGRRGEGGPDRGVGQA